MKVKKNEVALLLVVLGVLALVVAWQVIYKNNQTKIEELNAQNEELQKTVDRLEILNANKEQYKADTERMKTDGDAVMDDFAAGMRVEDQVMYLYNMELVDANDVRVPSVALQPAQAVPYEGALVTDDGYELVDDGVGMFRLPTTVGITTTNNGLKNVLNYIYGMDSKKSVTGVTLTTTEDGYLTGNMQLDFFYLTGTERPYADTNISGVSTGTTNIFGVLNGSAVQNVDGAEDADGENAQAEGVETGNVEDAQAQGAEAGNAEGAQAQGAEAGNAEGAQAQGAEAENADEEEQ